MKSPCTLVLIEFLILLLLLFVCSNANPLAEATSTITTNPPDIQTLSDAEYKVQLERLVAETLRSRAGREQPNKDDFERYYKIRKFLMRRKQQEGEEEDREVVDAQADEAATEVLSKLKSDDADLEQATEQFLKSRWWLKEKAIELPTAEETTTEQQQQSLPREQKSSFRSFPRFKFIYAENKSK